MRTICPSRPTSQPVLLLPKSTAQSPASPESDVQVRPSSADQARARRRGGDDPDGIAAIVIVAVVAIVVVPAPAIPVLGSLA